LIFQAVKDQYAGLDVVSDRNVMLDKTILGLESDIQGGLRVETIEDGMANSDGAG
jgi:hypothetical protein